MTATPLCSKAIQHEPLMDQVKPGDDKTSRTILVVDDEEHIHALTNTLLGNFRCEGMPLLILHAHSGEEAKQILAGRPESGAAFVINLPKIITATAASVAQGL